MVVGVSFVDMLPTFREHFSSLFQGEFFKLRETEFHVAPLVSGMK